MVKISMVSIIGRCSVCVMLMVSVIIEIISMNCELFLWFSRCVSGIIS